MPKSVPYRRSDALSTSKTINPTGGVEKSSQKANTRDSASPKKPSYSRERVCPLCGQTFQATHPSQRYCTSAMCRRERRFRAGISAIPLVDQRRICPVCMKEFSPRFGMQKFCSLECREEWNRDDPPAPRTCPVCGKSFEARGTRRKFCSILCKRKHEAVQGKLSRTRTVVCRVCGKTFQTTDPRKVFCSRECFLRRPRSERRTPGPLPERRCDLCGRFYRPKTVRSRFCSLDCSELARKHSKHEPRKCKVCGTEFVPRTHNQLTCSRVCSDIARAEQRDPKTHICVVCGKPVPSPRRRYCSPECVKRVKIYRRGQVPLQDQIRTCVTCGSLFTPHNSRQLHCRNCLCSK